MVYGITCLCYNYQTGIRTKGGALPPLMPFDMATSSPMPTLEVPPSVLSAQQTSPQIQYVLSLDKAVHLSMERLGQRCDAIVVVLPHRVTFLGSDEMRRKMYGCILLVGGGFTFSGGAQMLQNYMQSGLPSHYKRFVDRVEVLAKPKVHVCTTNFWISYSFCLSVCLLLPIGSYQCIFYLLQ